MKFFEGKEMSEQMVNTKVTRMIVERDAVIEARKEALIRYGQGDAAYKKAIYYEYVKPLTDRLNVLNHALGL